MNSNYIVHKCKIINLGLHLKMDRKISHPLRKDVKFIVKFNTFMQIK